MDFLHDNDEGGGWKGERRGEEEGGDEEWEGTLPAKHIKFLSM